MTFSSRLKRKNEAISAVHDRAIQRDSDLVALHRMLRALGKRLRIAPENEHEAIEREMEAIVSQIDELIYG